MADPALGNAQALLVLSERQRAVYEEAGVPSQRLVYAPNFLPDALDPGLSESPPNGSWLFVGRLSEEKGILELLKEWPKGEPLTILGDGPLRDQVESLAERTGAVVAGSVSRATVQEHMRGHWDSSCPVFGTKPSG